MNETDRCGLKKAMSLAEEFECFIQAFLEMEL